MPNRIAKLTPVASSKDSLHRFGDFVLQKRRDGLLTKAESDAVWKEMVDIADRAGGGIGPDDPVRVALQRHALVAMRKKLLELHPDWADEVRKLDNPGKER